jgi:hypothetical protein
MSTYISAGRIYTTNGPDITFDTDVPRLIITDQRSGSIARPQYRARAVNFTYDTEIVDTVVDVSLGSCALAATDVFGMQRSVWSSAPTSDNSNLAAATNGGEWISVSGSLVEYVCGGADDGRGITAGFAEISDMVNFKGLLMVDYYCSGGVIYLRETCKLRAYCAEASGFTFTTTIPARTIEYNLLCGYYGA